MIDPYNDILHVFNRHTDVLFGISNIDFSAFKSDYNCALIFAVPHKELLSINKL